MNLTRSVMLGAALCLTSACISQQGSQLTGGPCASAEFREFDFWIGEWEISQQILRPDGSWLELPARTRIAASPDGCVMTEHWSGQVQFFWEGMQEPEAIWGFSVRRFDPAERTWSIFWMDQRNPRFDSPHVGRFDGARGEFFREFEADGQSRRTRISFARLDDSRVDWELAVASDGGATWTPLWRMRMHRDRQ